MGNFKPDEDDPSYIEAMKEFFDPTAAKNFISQFFNEFVTGGLRKEYKDRGILMQLLAIEKTFDKLAEFKKEHETLKFKEIVSIALFHW